MIVQAVRRVPLEPNPAYRVAFVPELEGELFGLDEMDEVIQELETRLALHLEDIPGKRVEKVEGDDDMRKYRPSVANDLRFFFATIEERKLRVVLGFFPRKHNYRKKDLRAAAKRFRRFLESIQ